MSTWRSRPYYRTDCLSCGGTCLKSDRSYSAHRHWAMSHSQKNPGHQVAMESTITRSYLTEAKP